MTVVSIGYGLLETLSFLHVHEKVHPAFLCLVPSQNASPASLGSLPCEVQVAFTDLSLALPHSPAAGQSTSVPMIASRVQMFLYMCSSGCLTGMSDSTGLKQSSHGMWDSFRSQNENSAHHSGHLLCLEPRPHGCP